MAHFHLVNAYHPSYLSFRWSKLQRQFLSALYIFPIQIYFEHLAADGEFGSYSVPSLINKFSLTNSVNTIQISHIQKKGQGGSIYITPYSLCYRSSPIKALGIHHRSVPCTTRHKDRYNSSTSSEPAGASSANGCFPSSCQLPARCFNKTAPQILTYALGETNSSLGWGPFSIPSEKMLSFPSTNISETSRL